MATEAGPNSRIPGTRARMRDRQVRSSEALPLVTSTFSGGKVPDVLWPDLVSEFGVDYEYHMPEGDVITGVTGILVEGGEQEYRSPGRYARFWVDLRDLPREARAADWLLIGTSMYDVESVDATLFSISRLVIKLSGQCWGE